ncbi:hypothetical protein [Halorubrum distributum]|jgi:hypothetical protein|uniref:DUF1102 domain-containing protein n=1 Tax=Halorubrum distributum TaxID=29283 RepID=A0A6B1IJ36_9EURY|nr:hypothetical protein [Halorubrum terrestre]MYL68823.1 hypothetical protein [Halorubrum terrestre]
MDRRTLLKSLGVAGAGGAIVTGTGAFTSVEASRNVSVTVEGDASAYLSISEVSGAANSEYLTENGNGEKAIDLDSSNTTSGNGAGVNADAVTVIEDVFQVGNQGTQEVELDITPLTFVDTDGPDTLAVLVVPSTSFPAVTLGTGDSEAYSLVIDEFSPADGADLAIDSTINFTAEATN